MKKSGYYLLLFVFTVIVVIFTGLTKKTDPLNNAQSSLINGNSPADSGPRPSTSGGTPESLITDAKEETTKVLNHSRLVQLIASLSVINLATIGHDTSKDILQVLYLDMVTWAYLGEELSEDTLQEVTAAQTSFEQLQELKLIGETHHVSLAYKKELISLIERLQAGDKFGPVEFRRIVGFVKRRKRSSDVFFKVRMRQYLKSPSNSTEKKIAYVKALADAGDQSLVKYGQGYFEEQLVSESLNQATSNQIKAFLQGVESVN